MARATKITTGTGTPVATLLQSASTFYGVYATNAEAAAYFIKLWWSGTGTAPPTIPGGAQPAPTLPVAGTTVPSLTIAIPTSGLIPACELPLNLGGQLWYWITKNAADSDDTALTTGGDVVTFVYD